MKYDVTLLAVILVLMPSTLVEGAEEAEEGSLVSIEFEDLPKAVRKTARQEFSDQPLMAVEKQSEGGRVVYHVMFDVDGAEAGLRIS
ncbi:MAG: hypothetical protein AAF961_12160, partial [Planctomycetota bacterium]